MTYQVEFKQSAKKELARLPRPVAEKIVECVKTLANNPRPDGCKKLKGAEEFGLMIIGCCIRLLTSV